MNENPEGTPNPLGPVTPAAPAPEPVQTGPVISQPVMNTEPMLASKPAKKSKKPVIIAAIILILVAIGAAVAAIMVLNPFASHDAVPSAISKLFSTGAPQNVNLTGTITTYDNNKDAESLSLVINFSVDMNNMTTENVAAATVNATLLGNETFSFNVNEIHTKGGDLYLKLGGIAEFLTDYSAMFDVIDDEWIKIPSSEFSSVTSMLPDNMASCLVDAAGKLGEYGSDFKALYNENPFIEYSTANINIDAKKDTLYHLYFDSTKLTSFVNSIGNSGFANELMACAGELAVNENVTEEELSEVMKNIPTIYVEIDDKDNFTRLYMTMANEDGLAGAVMDISFTYPTASVTIEEPERYIDLGELLAELLSDFYGTEVVEETEVVEAAE